MANDYIVGIENSGHFCSTEVQLAASVVDALPLKLVSDDCSVAAVMALQLGSEADSVLSVVNVSLMQLSYSPTVAVHVALGLSHMVLVSTVVGSALTHSSYVALHAAWSPESV
jgi:hypothetical protein